MAGKSEVWRGRLQAWRDSGVSAAAFCRQHDLPYPQFIYWKRRLGKAASGLVPVAVHAPAIGRVEIALRSGAVVRLTGVSMGDVVDVVKALSC